MVDSSAAPAMHLRVETASPEETGMVGRALGSACRGGELLLLYGDLGSGKTCLVQGLAAGLGVEPGTPVTSPTFTIHAEYPGRVTLNHLDLYRLDESASLEDLGLMEMIADTGAATAVEWPEMLAPAVDGGCLEIRIADTGEGRRSLEFFAHGDAHAALLTAACRG